jgi:beta-glucanase (GH16 family)
MINTYKSNNFRYGYVEISAEMTKGQGLWPTLWLRNADSSVHSAIDIVEMIGQQPTQLFQTVHADDGSTIRASRGMVTDLSNGYHTDGVDWQPGQVSLDLDGVIKNSVATPRRLKVAMYFIANLAVGGSWVGDPDGTPNADPLSGYQRGSRLENLVQIGDTALQNGIRRRSTPPISFSDPADRLSRRGRSSSR